MSSSLIIPPIPEWPIPEWSPSSLPSSARRRPVLEPAVEGVDLGALGGPEPLGEVEHLRVGGAVGTSSAISTACSWWGTMFCANVTSAVLKVASAGTELLVAAGFVAAGAGSEREEAAGQQDAGEAGRVPSGAAVVRVERMVVSWVGGWAQGPARADGGRARGADSRRAGRSGARPRSAATQRRTSSGVAGRSTAVDADADRAVTRRTADRAQPRASQTASAASATPTPPARTARQTMHERVHRRGVPRGSLATHGVPALPASTWAVGAPEAWPSAVRHVHGDDAVVEGVPCTGSAAMHCRPCNREDGSQQEQCPAQPRPHRAPPADEQIPHQGTTGTRWSPRAGITTADELVAHATRDTVARYPRGI